MTAKPQRLRKKATVEEILENLPVQARVRPARWIVLLGIFMSTTSLFVWVAFWPPEDVSAAFPVWRAAAIAALPLALLYLPFAVMGVFRPRHVTFDEKRVWTRHWSIDWADVKSVGGASPQAEHTFQVCLFVSRKDWAEKGWRKANRWDSARPFQGGGLTNPEPCIRTQASMAPSAVALMDVFYELKKRNRRAGSPR
ncbi:MAG: hypothetical protein Q4G34_01295 [Micrococcus sp.]|nr:hypothetical protein [Micrococcus sp.]